MADLDSQQEELVVMALLAHYIPSKQIARYINISDSLFKDKYSYLDNFEYSINPEEAVENSLFKAACEGNNQSMMFYLKNKAGWDDGKTAKEQLDRDIAEDQYINKIEIELLTEQDVEEIRTKNKDD